MTDWLCFGLSVVVAAADELPFPWERQDTTAITYVIGSTDWNLHSLSPSSRTRNSVPIYNLVVWKCLKFCFLHQTRIISTNPSICTPTQLLISPDHGSVSLVNNPPLQSDWAYLCAPINVQFARQWKVPEQFIGSPFPFLPPTHSIGIGVWPPSVCLRKTIEMQVHVRLVS